MHSVSQGVPIDVCFSSSLSIDAASCRPKAMSVTQSVAFGQLDV